MARDVLIGKVERVQAMRVSDATGGREDGAEYAELRRELLANPRTKPHLPAFVRTCRDLHQFWQFIKHKYGSYAERRQFLWEEFRPLLESLEGEEGVIGPSDEELLA